jgi:NAD(P)H-flavin reductase/hemoglobin-like flavoprotein
MPAARTAKPEAAGAPPPLPPSPSPPALPPPPARTAGPLNPALIRKSLALITAGPQRVAGDFYGYLFAFNPGLRDMFPPQMNEQNERLFGALVRIAELLDDAKVLGEYLGQLGADHRKYGVEPEHYAAVGQALLRTLRRHVPAWTQDEEEAWSAAYTVAADMMIAGAAGHKGPACLDGRVVRHERRAADLAVLTVRTREPLLYQGGQYVTVQTGRWPRVWRAFSVANAPRGDGNELDLHVRAVPGGWVSTALVRDTLINSRLVIGPALGRMTPEAADGQDLLCVAGGTGLAPMKALAEAVLLDDEAAMARGEGMPRSVHLFHGAKNPADLYDLPALRELERCYPWLQVVPVVPGDERFRGEYGNVVEAALEYRPWTAEKTFVAGPAEMVHRAVQSFPLAGLPEVYFDAAELRVPGI